jgi:plasmid stabilization system protein ParE
VTNAAVALGVAPADDLTGQQRTHIVTQHARYLNPLAAQRLPRAAASVVSLVASHARCGHRRQTDGIPDPKGIVGATRARQHEERGGKRRGEGGGGIGGGEGQTQRESPLC